MRGFIQGSIWALLLGGVAVSTMSYLDDEGIVQFGGEVAPASEAPAAMTHFSGVLAAPGETDLPRMPRDARAPFTDPFVPLLANVAVQPVLPAIDGALVPAPVVAEAEAETPDEPVTSDASVTTTEAEPLPEVDTADATVETTAQAPEAVEPAEDGNQPPADDGQSDENGVVVNRLGTSSSQPAGQVAEVVEEAEVAEDAPALLRYAAPFENPEGLPLLAIVLIDDGAGGDTVSAVANLGFPVTIVVNALAPDAEAQMRAYRGAGAEVAMELALPRGAQPADVEVAFEAALGIMSDAAMLFSSGGDVIQGNRQVTGQVMQVLSDLGMGFVAEERGLGGAIRAAGQADVLAAPVERDLDGGGESASAIARALDQAAFRARQTGDTVLLARLDEATLAVLRDWAAANDGSGTAIGPVSALLLGNQ